jgi:ATP-dependent Clp protease protease subunit
MTLEEQTILAKQITGRSDEDDDEDDDDHKSPPGEAPLAGERSPYIERALIKGRLLMLTGPINDKLARYVSTRLLVMETEHPEKPVTIYINSPGGSADSGFAIYDMIRFVRPPVRTVVNGLCASAAVLVFLAGDKGQRFSLPESRFLIHQPSSYSMGTASDLDIAAREILKLRERYIKVIATESGQPDKKVLEDAARDFWLNSAAAKEYGLVNRIVTARDDID